jgi:hypothetical protein
MQRSISGRAWDVVAGFELAYATTAGDQIRVPLVDAWSPRRSRHDAAMMGRGQRRRCRFSNSVSFPEVLNCGDARSLTSCHLAFVSYSCHFFSTLVRESPSATVGHKHRRVHSQSFGHSDKRHHRL